MRLTADEALLVEARPQAVRTDPASVTDNLLWRFALNAFQRIAEEFGSTAPDNVLTLSQIVRIGRATLSRSHAQRGSCRAARRWRRPGSQAR